MHSETRHYIEFSMHVPLYSCAILRDLWNLFFAASYLCDTLAHSFRQRSWKLRLTQTKDCYTHVMCAISCYVATFSQTSTTTFFVEFNINILILPPLTTWRNSHSWCKIKTPKLLHGQQNSFIMLWTNGIFRPLVSLMIYDSWWKTGRSTGSCTKHNFLSDTFLCMPIKPNIFTFYVYECV